MKNPNTPTGWNDKINSILEQRNELSDRGQSELLEILKQDKEEKERKQTVTNTIRNNPILNDLKENHIKIEEDVEMMGYKWKVVHIDLPAMWNFEWFKFDYFVSNKSVDKENFESKSELKEKSYSMSDISTLLQAMNRYMVECWWWKYCTDKYDDYKKELNFVESNRDSCYAWYYLTLITWLDSWHWLSDTVAWKKDLRAVWQCHDNICAFDREDGDEFIEHNLFLKLSN